MNRAGLKTARQFALWKEGLEILDGITIDGKGDAETHLEHLTVGHEQALASHKESGSLEMAEDQLAALASAASAMAAALERLGLEARQAIFGGGLGVDHDEVLPDGYPFEGRVWLPSAAQFSEFADACRSEAGRSSRSSRHVKNGTPKFRPLLRLTPSHALVLACEDALLRVGRMERLKDLVRIVAELATGKKPSPRFAEREINSRSHRPTTG